MTSVDERPHRPTSSTQAAGTGQLSSPVAPAERIEALDIVRGFALFGVLLLNMLSFSGQVAGFEPWTISTGWWDRTVELAIRVFGEAAFYTTFSFLFGLGFALQLERATGRGERFSWRFAGRLLVLLAFGLLHAFLIWDGDILVQYSIAGFFLLPFARVRPSTALKWAAGLCGFTVVAATVLVSLWYPGFEVSTGADLAEDLDLFANGGFGEIAAYRLSSAIESLVIAAIGVPWFVGIFLVGLWAVRSGRVAAWRYQRVFLYRVLRVTVPIAVVAKGLLAVLIVSGDAAAAATFGTVLSVMIGGPALGATYVCLLLLALQRAADGVSRLRHLAPVGRMALTNYLTQSLIGVGLFYGYGLGWYGRFGVGTTVFFTVGIFAAQMVLSRLWLARYPFGPMEWLWRTLTYRMTVPAVRS